MDIVAGSGVLLVNPRKALDGINESVDLGLLVYEFFHDKVLSFK